MRTLPASARSLLASGRSVLSDQTIIGAVLTGGSSRRFGGDKAAVIGPYVLEAMRTAGLDPIVAIGGTPGTLPIPTVADRYPGEGPLGGVATALTFARAGRVLVATCDLPRLEAETIAAIVDCSRSAPASTAVVASIDGVPQPSLGCWPAKWAVPAHRAISAGERRFRHLLALGPIESVEVDPRSLSDADDRAALDALLADPNALPSGHDMNDPADREA